MRYGLSTSYFKMWKDLTFQTTGVRIHSWQPFWGGSGRWGDGQGGWLAAAGLAPHSAPRGSVLSSCWSSASWKREVSQTLGTGPPACWIFLGGAFLLVPALRPWRGSEHATKIWPLGSLNILNWRNFWKKKYQQKQDGPCELSPPCFSSFEQVIKPSLHQEERRQELGARKSVQTTWLNSVSSYLHHCVLPTNPNLCLVCSAQMCHFFV